MANVSSNWQDSLNYRLVNRLTRPLRQPGMMKMAMSQRIINRCDRFLNRLPLLNQQMQRWGNNITFSSDDVPIVYAQPVSLAQERGIENREENFQPIVSQNKPSVPLIQRKVDSSQALPVQTETIAFQNSTDLSNSNFSDGANPSLPLETQINQTFDSSSEIPVVSPQFTSKELPENWEMPLLQEFTKNSQQPLPIIQTKQQNSSRSPSSLPVVNPLNTSASPKQTQPDNYSSSKSSSIKYENLVTPIPSTNLPIVTVQPLNAQVNLTEEEISFAINSPNYQNQSLHISNPQINQNNNNKSTSYLPIVPVTSPNNSTSKPQSLPLFVANNSPSANSINHQPNLSQQNPTVSNTNSSSSPRIFASPSSPTETYVSTIAKQSNLNVDVDTIANQVERKLMRRLVIESERRGKTRWH